MIEGLIWKIEGLICYVVMCYVVWSASCALTKTLDSARRESHCIRFCWASGRLLFACFQPYPPITTGWVLLQGNENVGSVQDFVWCKSRELGDRRSPRVPTPMVESFSADFLPAIKSYWAESHLELFILYPSNFIYQFWVCSEITSMILSFE